MKPVCNTIISTLIQFEIEAKWYDFKGTSLLMLQETITVRGN
jgi:hypothetical protein